jgi:DNA-damage-inducible protein J
MKTEQIIVHVKPEIKADAMAIFEKIGISASEAVNLFLTHVVMAKRIPSDMYIPNEETLRAFQDSDSGRNMKKCETLDELYKDLNI